tara:strand:- start:108 stop:2576 length:2469 start_codon:yes stop_codon:yes gene_type:complete
MATLVSPGVDVTIVDESAYASPGAGTIPLIIIATEQDKTDPTGTETDGIAKYTKTANAGLVVPVTSQRELTQFFGDPTFALTEGAETSEYGLLTAYSYLGQGSQAYIVRADVDLGALASSETAPTGPANGNQIWLDTDGSSYGVHAWNATSGAWVLQTVVVEVALDAAAGEISDPSTYAPTATAATTPNDQNYLVAVLSDGTTGFALGYFVNENGTWTALNDAWQTAETKVVTLAPHYDSPTPTVTGDVWIKTTQPGNGTNLVVHQSNSLGVFSRLTVEAVARTEGGAVYVAQDGLSITDLAGTFTANAIVLAVGAGTTAGIQIELAAAGVGAAIAAVVYAQDAEPTGTATAGSYWFDPTATDLDILINDGAAWNRVAAANITYKTTEPLSPTNDDIWVETDGTEAQYPKIYRYDGANWLLYDNTDQTTGRGVLFNNFVADDRTALVDGDINANSTMFDSAPDYQLYPSDMLAVNMAFSSNTVRVWTEGVSINSGASTINTWVNAAANNADGSGLFGRLAQRKVISVAMQAAVAGNDDLRDPSRNFTLLCAPNFPELTDELVTLNSDRGETGFIIIDVPMRKTPTEAASWVLGVGATENGDEGLVTKNTYSAVYYPSGRSTTPAGNTVTVPASHMVLYTYAYNDNISYPWFAPAGLTRGVVQNGSAVGYITSEEEFKAVSLSEGQRNAAYTNKLNPIANFPLEGVVVFGQKTLHPTSSALDRVNVARLTAYLRERFDDIARPLLFEQNDKSTRDRAIQLFESFLSDLLTKRALTDFAVVCDTSNNTPIRIDRNELYIDIAIAPTKAVEFIYIPIRIVNTGAL